ncbi:MAG: M23 family metallopeptidase [Bacteroidales bacterium]|nr:M23 family metallopeptidase [Bacteroidales bacterium]
MAKPRYSFNPQSLTFTEEQRSRKDKAWLVVRYVLAFVIISAISYLVFPFVIDTPEVRKLKRENQKLVENFDHINRRVDNLRLVLEDLQHRDDNIYRTIFEAEPVPTTVRNVGMGGVDRYEQLEQMENGQLIIETSQKLDALAQKAYIQSRSFDEIIALAQRKEELVRCVPAIMPISDRNLTRMASSFGMRIHPFYKVLKMHTGMDFTAPTGTEIYATGDGEVCRVEQQQRGYGHNVMIDHGFGYKSLYAHMSKINVRPGQKVKRGQVIGLVGNTGTSVAPHLHYEVRINDQPVDPVNYYYNDLTPEQYDRMIELASMPTQSFD